MSVQTNVYDVIEKLSEDRKGIIFRLALDMLSAQQTEDYDNYSDGDVKAIQDARARVSSGDYISFSSADEMSAHFGAQ